MKKRITSYVLIMILAFNMFGCERKRKMSAEIPKEVEIKNVTASTTQVLKNYQQTDDPWGGHGLGGSANIWCTGCGIVSVCNAVHYATGYFISPAELADWANENGCGYGFDRTDGAVLYYNVGKTFGDGLGFEIEETGAVEDNGLPSVKLHITPSNEKKMKEKMISLIEGGATLVAHVKNHFISINDYDFSTDRFLVWDNCAGVSASGGAGYGSNRVGITHVDGDWFSFEDFRGTQKNGKGSYDYFKVDYVVPILPKEGVQLFHTERNELTVSGEKRQLTGKACNFTQLENVKAGDEIVFKGSYSSAAPYIIGYRIDGGSAVYEENFLTDPSESEIKEGAKWCGKKSVTKGFEIKAVMPDENAHTFEIVVKTGDAERTVWTAETKQ